MSKVYQVDQVTASIVRGKVEVRAEGQVNTGGWTDPELIAYVYVMPPLDGIQQFDFVATPPDGPSTDAFVPVKADTTFEKPDWLKGVRVYAQTNDKEALISEGKEAMA